MANPIASGTFSRETLTAAYHGNREVITTRDYRVFFDPATGMVEVMVRLNDTATGAPVWFPAVSYTAA